MVLFIARQSTTVGRVGRVLIGLGLMLLALRLVTESAGVLTQAPAVKALLASLSSDLLLEITVGALLAVLCYSSLAIVLLTAALAASGVVPVDVALGLVLGANLGSGALAVLTTLNSKVETRQVPLGNLVFKLLGVAIAAPLTGLWLRHVGPLLLDKAVIVVLFHLAFNLLVGLVFIGLTQWEHAGSATGCRSRPNPPCPGARGTWTPRRWPRPRWRFPVPCANRCTRPMWWKPCCAA